MKLRVLNWKEIKRSSERQLENEVKRISNLYARRARDLEKAIGKELFEAAYGKRLTAKQVREQFVNERDGRYKFRKAYQRWRDFDINANYLKRREYEGRKKIAEDRYKEFEDLSLEKKLDLTRREDLIARNPEFKRLMEERGYILSEDLSNLSELINDVIIEDPTNLLSTTDLAKEEHSYETKVEYRVHLIEELARMLGV